MTPSARSLAASPNSSFLGASAPNNTRRQSRIDYAAAEAAKDKNVLALKASAK